jgi:hypothetical protein
MALTPGDWLRERARETADDEIMKQFMESFATAFDEHYPAPIAGVGLNVEHLRSKVIQPALGKIGLWSMPAEELLLGTAAQESALRHLTQLGSGPARGLLQVEVGTHTGVWLNHVRYRPQLRDTLLGMVGSELIEVDIDGGEDSDTIFMPHHNCLITKLDYAFCIARLKYRMTPEPLPDPKDVEAMGAYWKKHYNTAAGAGTIEEFVVNYKRLVKS